MDQSTLERHWAEVRDAVSLDGEGLDSAGMPRLIGITGKKRAGKDTLGAILTEEYGYVRSAFADPLKDALERMDPLITSNDLRLSEILMSLSGWERAKSFPEVRRALQGFGDAARHLDPRIFVRKQEQIMQEAADAGQRLVITDARRLNELDAVADRGGLILRIVRPDEEDLQDDHISEREFLNYRRPHIILRNGGTVDDLRERVRSLFSHLRGE